MPRIYPDVTNVRRTDILTKIHPSEIVPKQACVFGYKYKTTQVWVLVGLLLLSSFSLVGTIYMWFTSSFDNLVLSHLVISNNSDAIDTFSTPVTTSFLKVYIFNYTNVDEFLEGEAPKLRVKEMGPYVYERFLERIDVILNDNGTLSYRERNSFNFRADLSKGRRQSDKLNVPNIPMLAAASKGKQTQPLQQWGFSQFFKIMGSEPFTQVPAHRFIWGYQDNVFDFAKTLAKFTNPLPYEEFGLLAEKNGTSDDVITVSNGETSFDRFGYILSYNGESELPHWSTSECRKIEGSDGSFFPPYDVRAKKTVYFYAKELCRRMPLNFDREVKIFNSTVSAFRYSIPSNVFDDPSHNNENQCYCDLDSGICPPHGIFNTTPCSFEAPAFMSFPHFYLADSTVIDAVEGLRPKKEKHDSFLNLHPSLGYVMSGRTRFQVNFQVKKSLGITQLDRFDDDMLLPVAWFEASLEEDKLSEKAMELIYRSTHTVQGYELAFKYGFLLTHIMTVIFIAALIKAKFYKQIILHDRRDSSQLISNI